MIVMPSSHCSFESGRLFERYPDRLAHLHNVDGGKTMEPKADVQWALDNGAYGAWKNGKPWDEELFYSYLETYAIYIPMWVAVPDAVGDRDLTLDLWTEHYPAVASFGLPLAFVVQDEMTVSDVPDAADVVFVGGTFSWKWRNLKDWCSPFDRVHVGRVNTLKQLWQAHEAGAESCDGTGWFRGGPHRLQGLVNYLAESERKERTQPCLTL